MASPIVTNSGVDLNGKTLLLAETSTNVSGGLIPASDAIQIGWIMRKKTVLTHAQILVLPTTPIAVLAAPLSGSRIKPLACSLLINTTAGAYTNIDTAYCALQISLGTDILGYGPINDSTTTPALVSMTDLFAGANQRIYDLVIPNVSVPGGGPPSFFQYAQNVNYGNRGQQEAAAFMLSIDNNGSGVLTGGNAANTLSVITYYIVEPF